MNELKNYVKQIYTLSKENLFVAFAVLNLIIGMIVAAVSSIGGFVVIAILLGLLVALPAYLRK